MSNLGWLNNVDGVYFGQCLLASVGLQDSRDFVSHRALSPIGWEDLQIVSQLKENLPLECHQQANYCLSVTISLTKLSRLVLALTVKGAVWLSRVQRGSVGCIVAQSS